MNLAKPQAPLRTNFPEIEFLFPSGYDIPGYVADGRAELGLWGKMKWSKMDKAVLNPQKLALQIADFH